MGEHFQMARVKGLPLFFLSFTLGHILRSEDADTPYILSDGNSYRDVATVETAKKVAIFAKQIKPIDKSVKNKVTNIISPEFHNSRNFTYGSLKPDDEIFDFIDSRFLNPPIENRQNRPLPDDDGIIATSTSSYKEEEQEQPSIHSSSLDGSHRTSSSSPGIRVGKIELRPLGENDEGSESLKFNTFWISRF